MWKYCVIRVRKPLRNKHELISALLTDSPLPSDYKSGENYCYELLYSAPEQSESFSMGEKMVINGMDACEAWLEQNADFGSTYTIQKLYFYE